METFYSIIDYIARTNLFNFIVFASILIYIFKKLNLDLMLSNMKDDVIEKVETSKQTKKTSEDYLKDMEDVISAVEEEIDIILKKSDKNAKLIGEKVLSEADSLVENIKENSSKLVENKTVLLKNDILKRASEASIEVAKNHIINELNNNYDLHYRIMHESVDAIDEVSLL